MSSETNTPAFTSTSITTTGNETTLVDEVKKYNTEDLISFLRAGPGLIQEDYNIIKNERVDGWDFLKMTKQDFRDYGMKGKPAIRLAEFVKECKEKKLRAFLTYRSLKEVLKDYDIESEGIEAISLFTPPTYEIQNDDKYFKECITEINKRLRDYGTLRLDSLEAMRNEYIVSILHTALHIIMNDTNKEFSMHPQHEIIREKSSGRVDYAIKESEDLICITENKQHKVPMGFAQNIKQLESSYETNKKKRIWDEAFGDNDFDYLYGIVTTARNWHFLLYSPGEISQASEALLTIEFNKKALEKNSEKYQALHNGMKKVLRMTVGLLKDRACVAKSPSSKRVRIEGYRSKK